MLSKAAFELARRRGARTQGIAAGAGYVATELAKEAPYYAGAFGTALAIHAARAGRPTRLWARRAEAAHAMSEARENRVYLPGAAFPERLEVTHDLDALAAANPDLTCWRKLREERFHHGGFANPWLASDEDDLPLTVQRVPEPSM